MQSLSLAIDEVNNLASDHFIKIFGNVVEHYPPAAIGILKNRPFRDATDLSEAINSYLDACPLSEKEHILQLHPDLAGKLADLGKLTEESANEQSSAGLDHLSSEEKAALNSLNSKYTKKFGFPAIICVKGLNITTIIQEFETRLRNNREQEIDKAIEEVKKISKIRICNIIKS